jgi:hypothetical protein
MDNRNTLLGDDGAFFGWQLGPTLAEQQKQLDKLQQAIRQAEARQSALAKDLPLDFLDGNVDYGKKLREVISTAVLGAISGLSGNVAGAAAGAVTGNVLNAVAPGVAGDAGAAVGLQIRGMFFGQNWWQQRQQQQQADRQTSLQATESRFLTRGRGTLSPAEKKQEERDNRQLAELKAIRDELKNLGGNAVLVVEGIA